MSTGILSNTVPLKELVAKTIKAVLLGRAEDYVNKSEDD